MLDQDTIGRLLAAPIAETVDAYPAGEGHVAFRAVDAQGAELAVFRVPRAAAARLADGTLPAALILGDAVADAHD